MRVYHKKEMNIMKHTSRIIALLLLTVMCVGLLISCAPASDPAKAKEALEENGYTALKYEAANIKGLLELMGVESDDHLETAVYGMKDGSAVYILYFDSTKAAREYWTENKDSLTDGLEKDEVAAQSGKMVYVGNKDAVKAAR